MCAEVHIVPHMSDACAITTPKTAFDVMHHSDNPMIFAALYEWVLDKIDPAHPLYGITYVGQLVREGKTPEQAFDERTREHINNSIRQPKAAGIHWAIQNFGVASFTFHLIAGERKHAIHVEASKWANEREQTIRSL